MRYAILLVALCGCGTEAIQVDVEKPVPQFEVTIQNVAKTSDAILSAVKQNDTSIKAVWTKLEALDLTLSTLKPQTGKDGDLQSSPSPPESPAKANTQQPPVQVATPGTSSFRTASDGTVLRWNINGDWNPTILETSAHLAAEHGIDTNGMTHQQMADIHADIHEGKTSGGAPLTGSIFQNNRAGAITSQRTTFRSVPQRVSFFGRTKYSNRQSCPSGRCPQR